MKYMIKMAKDSHDYIKIAITLLSKSVVSDVQVIMPTNDFEYGGVYLDEEN